MRIVNKINDVLKETLERIAILRKPDTAEISGIPSGYHYLDAITKGWQPADLIILASHSGVGKTAFALNLALNAVTDLAKPTVTAIFSLEMSAGQIAQRMLSIKSGVLLERISSGKMEDYEMKHLMVKGIEPLSKTKIFIDDTPALSTSELRTKCLRLKDENNPGLIIIDYLQLMSGAYDKNNTYIFKCRKISEDLKSLALELQLPVIVLSQLSRETERRRDDNKMPMLSDLAIFGINDRDADMILFLYRPEYDAPENESIKGLTQLRIAKHKKGRSGIINYKARLDIQRFEEMEDYDDGDSGQ